MTGRAEFTGRPTWGGLAVRWDDGKLLKIQLQNPEVLLECKRHFKSHDPYGDFWSPFTEQTLLSTFFRVRLSGLAIPWEAPFHMERPETQRQITDRYGSQGHPDMDDW